MLVSGDYFLFPKQLEGQEAPARLSKGCILGMFEDELPGTGTRLCLMSITLVQPISADAWKQL